MKEETPPKTAEEIREHAEKRYPYDRNTSAYAQRKRNFEVRAFCDGAKWAFASTPTSKQEGEAELRERIIKRLKKAAWLETEKGGGKYHALALDSALVIVEDELSSIQQEGRREEAVSDELIAFAKRCFYEGFTACEKDDANCYTAWRERAGNLLATIGAASIPPNKGKEAEKGQVKQGSRPMGWYRVRTRLGWMDCFYHEGWKLDSNLFVLEVKEAAEE